MNTHKKMNETFTTPIFRTMMSDEEVLETMRVSDYNIIDVAGTSWLNGQLVPYSKDRPAYNTVIWPSKLDFRGLCAFVRDTYNSMPEVIWAREEDIAEYQVMKNGRIMLFGEKNLNVRDEFIDTSMKKRDSEEGVYFLRFDKLLEEKIDELATDGWGSLRITMPMRVIDMYIFLKTSQDARSGVEIGVLAEHNLAEYLTGRILKTTPHDHGSGHQKELEQHVGSLLKQFPSLSGVQ